MTHHVHNLCESIEELERAVGRLSHVPKFLRDAITTAKGRRIAAQNWQSATAEVQREMFPGSTPPGGIIPTGKTDTSLEAAHFQAKTGKASSDRVRILAALARYPRTSDRLQHVLDMSHQTCSARVHDLNRSGLIADSQRRERTRAGRQAIVWQLTNAGREALNRQ